MANAHYLMLLLLLLLACSTAQIPNQPAAQSLRVLRKRSGTLTVSGRPGEDPDSHLITLTAEVSPEEVQMLKSNSFVSVIAHLYEDGASCKFKANITASVYSDDGKICEVQLRDDGAGPDGNADDSTYIGYLPILKLNEARDYFVSVKCHSPIQRVASATRLAVRQKNPQLKDASPGFINDQDIQVNNNAREAWLTWTAGYDPSGTGSDLISIVRYSTDFEQIRTNFSSCPSLPRGRAAPGSRMRVNVFEILVHHAGQGVWFSIVESTQSGTLGRPSSAVQAWVSNRMTPAAQTVIYHSPEPIPVSVVQGKVTAEPNRNCATQTVPATYALLTLLAAAFASGLH